MKTFLKERKYIYIYISENTTSSSPNSTEDNSLTTSGIGTSAETTMHYNSTVSDTSFNFSMTPKIMPMATNPVQTSLGLECLGRLA